MHHRKETEFPQGLFAKAPHENAPGYVKARISIKREDLIAWLSERDDEWINIDIKESQNGKWYAAVDDWKPDRSRGGADRSQRAAPRQQPAQQATHSSDGFDDDDIPF